MQTGDVDWRALELERRTSLTRAQVAWRVVAEGVEYADVVALTSPSHGDGHVHLVRIDPQVAQLEVRSAFSEGGVPRTAAAWSRETGLSVAFNAGMFEPNLEHTGALRTSRTDQGRWLAKYKSVLVSRGDSVTLSDVDVDVEPDARCDLVVQNLRLIRSSAQNVWPQSTRKWSEAALAGLEDGRLLVIFSRSPLTMHDFNQTVLSLGLGVDTAMHLEGGPEASLSIHAGGVDVDLAGSFETGFHEDDSNKVQWPIPNVLGVRR